MFVPTFRYWIEVTSASAPSAADVTATGVSTPIRMRARAPPSSAQRVGRLRDLPLALEAADHELDAQAQLRAAVLGRPFLGGLRLRRLRFRGFGLRLLLRPALTGRASSAAATAKARVAARRLSMAVSFSFAPESSSGSSGTISSGRISTRRGSASGAGRSATTQRFGRASVSLTHALGERSSASASPGGTITSGSAAASGRRGAPASRRRGERRSGCDHGGLRVAQRRRVVADRLAAGAPARRLAPPRDDRDSASSSTAAAARAGQSQTGATRAAPPARPPLGGCAPRARETAPAATS